MQFKVKNLKLASAGEQKLSWARSHMPALAKVAERFKKEKPFKGLRIGMALHVTKETGILVETLQAGGAEVSIASCNPLSTQDDTAAALAKRGFAVFAYKGETKSDYYKFIKEVIARKPHITIDDGCDLVSEIHLKHAELIPKIIGGCEETTTGIHRLKAMEADGALKYPMVAVNDNKTKHMFDNFYGTGQSTWDGILRATNILVAGRTVVVSGYGDCGRGVALRAAGMGAHVIVTEIDPVAALQAAHDGYRVMPMNQACELGDVFITVTGGKHVIGTQHMKKMKDGAILANSGHFNVEIDTDGLERLATAKTEVRSFTVEYVIPGSESGRHPEHQHLLAGKKEASPQGARKTLYLLGEGRLINLAAAEGHPSEVMDLSFCGQALACEWLVNSAARGVIANHARHPGPGRHPEPPLREDKLREGSHQSSALQPRVYTLPPEVDQEIARLKLQSLGLAIDFPTREQQKYASSWREGT